MNRRLLAKRSRKKNTIAITTVNAKKPERNADDDARQAARYHRIQAWEETNEVTRFAAWGDSSRVPPIQHPVDVGLRELSYGTSTGRVLLQPMVPAVPPATSPDAGADNLEAQLFGIAATPFTGRIGASESMTLLHSRLCEFSEVLFDMFQMASLALA